MHDILGRRPAAPTQARSRLWDHWRAAGAAGALLALALTGIAGAQGSWLDGPPRSWSSAGSAVPAAPPADAAVWPACRARERAPSGAEEQQVTAAGWRLMSYWATQRAEKLALVMATASHDGMCRPWGYNAFVFAEGRFAGTLSPEPMISRTTGALDTAALLPDGRVEATFRRYAPRDPLCCSSLPAARVVYRVDSASAGPVVVPERIAFLAAPAHLPQAGGPPLGASATAGAALLLAGLALRWAACPRHTG